MNEEIEEQVTEVAASEQPNVDAQDNPDEVESKMVPLAALQAERRKRQEETEKRKESDARAQMYQDHLLRSREDQQAALEPEDPNALVEKHVLKQTTESTKREILETLYQDMNPKAVQEINKFLKPILEKKPWLAASVDTAQNRYARAFEIVEDYRHLVEEKPLTKHVSNTDGKRIIENAQKPRSPVEIGKSSRPGSTDYLKSIQGKKEFREYRQKVLQGGM